MIDLPAWMPPEVWQEWIDYRREDKKKPASERSQRMTLRRLESLMADGYDPVLLLENAIAREWLGVFEDDLCKIDRRDRETHRRTNAPRSAVERVHAAAGPGRIVRIVDPDG